MYLNILLLFGLVAVLGPWASAENKTVVIVKRSAPANARARDAVVLPVRTRAVSRPRASAFAANAHSPVAAIGGPRSFGGDSGDSRAGMDSDATGMNSVGTSMNSAMASSMDFNPALLGGIRGAPGLKIRINMPTFRYVTMLVRQILDREIIRARIPPISQEIQELRGRISVCNIYVSSYRPPCDVAVVPIAPNSVLLSIHDLDIGITGNLDGQIGLLLIPIPLCGIIHVNFYHLSLDVLLSLQIGPDGMPFVTVSSCTACVGYVDLCIECGGLVGEIANLPLFRRMAAERVQKMVTDQICKSVPQLVNERVNPMLRRLPRGISYNQIVSMTGGLLGPEVPPICYSPMCQQRNKASTPASSTVAPAEMSATPPPNVPPPPAINSNSASRTAPLPIATQVHPASASAAPAPLASASLFNRRRMLSAGPSIRAIKQAKHSHHRRPRRAAERVFPRREQAHSNKRPVSRHVPYAQRPSRAIVLPVSRQPRLLSLGAHGSSLASEALVFSADDFGHLTQQGKRIFVRSNGSVALARGVAIGGAGNGGPVMVGMRGASPGGGAGGMSQVGMRGAGDGGGMNQVGMRGIGGGDPCAICPPGSGDDPLGAVMSLLRSSFDFRRLADLVLSLRIVNGYVTPNDLNIDVSGEFSPGGNGGTPFGPFPMQFPSPIGNRMVEVLISDYVINSLLYWKHRRGFLGFRIGPDTPKIGALLKTTCESEESEETSDESDTRRARRLSFLRIFRRQKRQDLSSVDLADLGVCFGDIMPAIAEKYPNKNLSLFIHTARAPSVLLRAGGLVTVDLVAFADIFIDQTNIRVGTITVRAVIELRVRIVGSRLTGTAELQVLQLTDRDKTLGLPQDALDNLANLGKDMVVKAANKQLEKGMELKIPPLDLPIQIIRPEAAMVDHAIYLGAEIQVSESLLSGSS